MSRPLLSICIPTYNRADHLNNCLHSIKTAAKIVSGEFEICVSDNASQDQTKEVVAQFGSNISLKYMCNARNLGIPRNFMNVVDMASGEFVWLVGDDDLLVPNALERLLILIKTHPGAEFFYVNAYHLNADHLAAFPSPFDVKNLPEAMERFSSRKAIGEMAFFDLIDPATSFDFLGGMFLSVFKRQNWLDHCNALDSAAIESDITFSHFDNTFPHVKIFASAFANSRAVFNAEPMIVCLTGVREWAPKYKMVRSFRLVEALESYRRAGLGLKRYHLCRNYALRDFLPDILWMRLHRDVSGIELVSVRRALFRNLAYPNLYLSIFYFLWQKLVQNNRSTWLS